MRTGFARDRPHKEFWGSRVGSWGTGPCIFQKDISSIWINRHRGGEGVTITCEGEWASVCQFTIDYSNSMWKAPRGKTGSPLEAIVKSCLSAWCWRIGWETERALNLSPWQWVKLLGPLSCRRDGAGMCRQISTCHRQLLKVSPNTPKWRRVLSNSSTASTTAFQNSLRILSPLPPWLSPRPTQLSAFMFTQFWGDSEISVVTNELTSQLCPWFHFL